jgi:CheY-like chemotaxis protein
MGQKIESQVALVVEDDAEVRALAAALLEETDLKVVEASSGEEALQFLYDHANEVTFVFADVRLPYRLNGIDLARTVKLKWPWITTLLTSGAPPDESPVMALRNIRFMPKPWRALDVLMEAEKATKDHGQGEVMPQRYTVRN